MQSHKWSKKLNEQDLGIVTGGVSEPESSVSKPEKGTCPKCGSSSVDTYWGALASTGVYVGVKCLNCGYKGPEQPFFPWRP